MHVESSHADRPVDKSWHTCRTIKPR